MYIAQKKKKSSRDIFDYPGGKKSNHASIIWYQRAQQISWDVHRKCFPSLFTTIMLITWQFCPFLKCYAFSFIPDNEAHISCVWKGHYVQLALLFWTHYPHHTFYPVAFIQRGTGLQHKAQYRTTLCVVPHTLEVLPKISAFFFFCTEIIKTITQRILTQIIKNKS